jgi:hypothetical protein
MGSVVLSVLVSLAAGVLGGYLLGRNAGRKQAQRQLEPSVRQASADAIVDFLRLVNEHRPREADAVRGLAWEAYGDYSGYIMDRLRESPFRPKLDM